MPHHLVAGAPDPPAAVTDGAVHGDGATVRIRCGAVAARQL